MPFENRFNLKAKMPIQQRREQLLHIGVAGNTLVVLICTYEYVVCVGIGAVYHYSEVRSGILE